MFDIGWSELIVIGIVALIAIGPKELPGVLRMLGQWMGKVRSMASDFQDQFREAMREAEMADLKKQVDEFSDVTRDFGNFDPIETARKHVESAIEDKPAVPAGADAAAGSAVQTADPAVQPAAAEDAATPGAPTAAAGPEPRPLASAPEPSAQADDKAAAAAPDAVKESGGGRAA